ncbi:PREDICTED: pleckstrin homology domain-containing family A member 8 [Nicrophorus vespilloides]|uniref:Pleckstrin homology domain-containing family A member 8 n=1 Tax=Nicrophorus vespilloides TaxID=110193 RepID=A0ABM1MLD9_NICVS|nr:PREDICTED: pleckstrin homology domain-containing family A member 8 [Nicrophorus vespilloides]
MSVTNGDCNGLPVEDVSTVFSTTMPPFPYCEHGRIATEEFLDAARGVVALVDKMGKVFAAVRYDMNGNIVKLNAKFEKDRSKYFYLEDMILSEKNEGENLVTDALQWLRRGLHFMQRFLECVLSDVEGKTNLSNFLKVAYLETLEPYHGWMGTQLFNIMCKFSPNRDDFFYVLGMEAHNKNEHVMRDMGKFVRNLGLCVGQLVQFYAEHNLERTNRV